MEMTVMEISMAMNEAESQCIKGILKLVELNGIEKNIFSGHEKLTLNRIIEFAKQARREMK